MANFRKCTKCGISKEEIEENFYVRKRGGFQASCKCCTKISYAARYAKSTEEIREYNRQQYNKHKITRQASRKDKRTSSFDHKIKHVLRNCKQRAALKGWSFNIDYDYIKNLYEKQGGLCFYTGVELSLVGDNKVSIDRTDPKLGYIKGNVKLVAFKVNIVKTDLTHEDFINMCKTIGARFNAHDST